MTGNGRFCSSYEVSPSSFRYYSSSVEYLTGICCPSVLWYILLVLVHFFSFQYSLKQATKLRHCGNWFIFIDFRSFWNLKTAHLCSLSHLIQKSHHIIKKFIHILSFASGHNILRVMRSSMVFKKYFHWFWNCIFDMFQKPLFLTFFLACFFDIFI